MSTGESRETNGTTVLMRMTYTLAAMFFVGTVGMVLGAPFMDGEYLFGEKH